MLDHQLKVALAAPPVRVRRIDLPDGRRFWLKRVERLTGILRVQKGDPYRAFVSEREGLRALAEAGLPVARIASEGPDWMLMADAGPILPEVVDDPLRSETERRAAFAQAGRALGLLHLAGLTHGRPAMRDICWDGFEARFIDLERFRQGASSKWRQAVDVLIFAQTAFRQWPEDARWLDVALDAYAKSAPAGVMDRVRQLAFVLSPIGWLTAGLARLRPQSRELRAVGLMLARLRRT